MENVATTFSLKSFIFSPPRRQCLRFSQEPQVSVCFSLLYTPQEWEILLPAPLLSKHIAVVYNRVNWM
jgi:hypothetical protein